MVRTLALATHYNNINIMYETPGLQLRMAQGRIDEFAQSEVRLVVRDYKFAEMIMTLGSRDAVLP